jgi:hypothetical protein
MKNYFYDLYLRMPFQRLNASLVLVIPDLNQTIIGATDEVGLVAAVVIVDAVDALLVTVQREVGRVRA